MSTPFSAQSALSPAGPVAASLAEVTWVLTVGASLIFVGVLLLLAWALRGRLAARVDARLWVIGGGLVFPAVVLVALFVYSMDRAPPWRAIPPKDALVIGVTGHLWWWEVRYRDERTGHDIATANEIRIPVGRPVYLGLSSADVIHSFWVPALGGKMDMLPGRMQHLLLQADRPGVYRGQCAEFCGAQHARMALHVVALPPDDFAQWLQTQRQPAATDAASKELERGRAAFMSYRCGACHTVRGVSEESRLGPDLTHVGGRLALAAGVLPNNADALADWVLHVQAHKPGARMPSAEGRIDPETTRAIAAWLSSLK